MFGGRKFDQLRLTQHKRFMPDGTHPNFCFAKTSFMLGTVSAIRFVLKKLSSIRLSQGVRK